MEGLRTPIRNGVRVRVTWDMESLNCPPVTPIRDRNRVTGRVGCSRC